MAKKFFEIDAENKKFVFTKKNFEELFVENSAVNKAFKAAMALGCYEGYVPVEGKKNQNPDRNTAAQQFNEAGVITWLKENKPDYIAKWNAMKAVRQADNSKYSFMVRKNVFLFDNEGARTYCGMKEETSADYALTARGQALEDAVSTWIKNNPKKVENWIKEFKADIEKEREVKED